MALINIRQKLRGAFSDQQAAVLAEVIHESYTDLVHTGDFNELKAIVRDLAIAQQRTEQRVEELAVAQQRTEQRVEELAEAQQRTEQRLGRLEATVQSLAEAQQRTEYALQNLSRQVGGLSNRLGGDLEDVAYIVIHDILQRELGWQVDPLARTWQQWDGQKEEIDIFGQAHDPARPQLPIWIVGEVKFNLTLRDVERFAPKVVRARAHLTGEVFPVCFCYRARPEVQRAVQEADFHLVFSYGRMV